MKKILLIGTGGTIAEVGKTVKQQLDLMETYDMNIEAALSKLMWILARTKDPAAVREEFYTPVNRDIL